MSKIFVTAGSKPKRKQKEKKLIRKCQEKEQEDLEEEE